MADLNTPDIRAMQAAEQEKLERARQSVTAVRSALDSTEARGTPETICDVCREPLTDHDEHGPYRLACSALHSQWCVHWTSDRERRHDEHAGKETEA